jgi:hypothetical protein
MPETQPNRYKQSDIRQIVEDFQKNNRPEERYASFDYCYNYFKGNEGSFLIQNMERSCMTLGFYLASWGMLRGSSFLLTKSAKHYQPLIEYISGLNRDIWDIDAHTLQENIQTVLDMVIPPFLTGLRSRIRPPWPTSVWG